MEQQAVASRPGAQRLPRRFRSGLPAVGWLAPVLLVVGFVIGYPIIRVILDSFTSRSPFDLGEFVGIANYRSLLVGGDSDLFWLSFRNNLILLISVPVTMVVSLLVSSVLFRGIRGGPLYEFFLFLPFLPAVAAISVIFIYLLGWTGPLNETLRGLGLTSLAQPWLTEPSLAIWSILAVVVWKRIGFVILLFMARMLSIDRELIDAAAVDGATWFQSVRYVIIPEMRAILQFVAMLGYIEVFSFTFAYVFVLTRGGPFNTTYTLEFLLFNIQFRRRLIGLASAVAVILLIMALAVAIYRVISARSEVKP